MRFIRWLFNLPKPESNVIVTINPANPIVYIVKE